MPQNTQDIPSQPFSFESARLIYRGIDKDDFDLFYKNGLDAESVSALNPNIQLPPSRKKVEDTMAFLGEHALIGAVICLRPTESSSTAIPIGHIMLSKAPQTMSHHRNCELGIGLLREYRGKGYGSEAIKWMLNWGFRMANMHRIALECHEWNDGAAKLYQKLGFTLEGRKRGFLWFNGRWWDKLEFSMLEHEWSLLQKGVE